MNQPRPKPFCISKHDVVEAWKRVKANQGAAGVDEESLRDFERKLKDNLYRVWNRMSSGSYLPPPVTGKNGEYPEIRGWGAKVRHTNCGRQGGPDGGQDELGAKD